MRIAKQNKEIPFEPHLLWDFCNHDIKLLKARHFRARDIPQSYTSLTNSFNLEPSTILVRKEKGLKGRKETNNVQRCLRFQEFLKCLPICHRVSVVSINWQMGVRWCGQQKLRTYFKKTMQIMYHVITVRLNKCELQVVYFSNAKSKAFKIPLS